MGGGPGHDLSKARVTGLQPTAHSPQSGVRGWLLLLCLLLTIWEPASLALVAASRVAEVATGNLASMVLLLARLFVTAAGVAAGIALWRRHSHAVTLARAALVLSALEDVARIFSRYGASTAPPGTRLPVALFIVCYYAAWLAYLQKSKRVKSTFAL